MINLKKCLNTFPSHFNFSKNLNIHLIRLFSDEPIKIEKPHPFSRTYQILEKDVYNIAYRYTKNQSYLMKSQYFPQHCDILILGGGLLGSAIAHELQSKGRDQLSVILLDNMPIKLNKEIEAKENEIKKTYADKVKEDSINFIKEMTTLKKENYLKEKKYRQEISEEIERRENYRLKEREIQIQTEEQDIKNMEEELEIKNLIDQEIQKKASSIQKKNYEQSLQMKNATKERQRLEEIDAERLRFAIENAKRDVSRMKKIHDAEEQKGKLGKLDRVKQLIKTSIGSREAFEAKILQRDLARQEQSEIEKKKKLQNHQNLLIAEIRDQEREFRVKERLEKQEGIEKLKFEYQNRLKEEKEIQHCDQVQAEKNKRFLLQRRHILQNQKDNAAHESTLTKEYMFGCLTSQFSNPLHRKMSRFTKEFIRTSKESLKLYGSPAPFIRYTPTGSLLMADLNEADALINIYNEQGNEGNKVKLLTKRKLAELFPWMSLEGIELGLHCLRNEGWYDVTTFREALRVKASAMGTHIIEAEPMQFQFRRMSDMLMAHTKPGQYQNVNDIIIKDREGVFRSITYGILIITETGGPDPGKWLENIFKMIRIGDETNDSRYLQSRLPIISKKRRSYTILSDEGPGMNCPLLLDSSGLFLRREGLAGEYVCSLADDSDNQSIKEKTLQAVANRIPSLANAKITGEFDCEFTYNVFDGCGLLGPHPHYINVYLACGFNTLEPQIAPALSKAICDMIIEGMLFDEMDVSELTIDRLFSNSPMNELISL